MTLTERPITIRDAGVELAADLVVPDSADGIVVFAHGTGSSRLSPRNRQVATTLHEHGFATLLLDLLTRDEDAHEMRGGRQRFDIGMLAQRLTAAVDWVDSDERTADLPVGLFGASTGAAAALVAATEGPAVVRAVVSRGGRPDLAGPVLSRVQAPTLLIVGGEDTVVIRMNADAYDQLPGVRRLELIPGAGHLFEEPRALEAVARLAAEWFDRYLRRQSSVSAS